MIEGLFIGLAAGLAIPVGCSAGIIIYIKRHRKEIAKLVMHKMMEKARDNRMPEHEMLP